MTLVKAGYVTRKTVGSRGDAGDNPKNYRNWWLIKHSGGKYHNIGYAQIGDVHFPKEYVGKRVRFKVEVIE